MKIRKFFLSFTALILAFCLSSCSGMTSYVYKEYINIKEAKDTLTLSDVLPSVSKDLPNKTESSLLETLLTDTDESKEKVPERTYVKVSHLENRFYLRNVPNELYEDFYRIYNGVMNFENSVELSGKVNVKYLEVLLFLVRYECPEIFQISQDGFTIYQNHITDNMVSASFKYSLSQSDYEGKMAKIKESTAKVLSETEGMSEEKKEKYLYDYVTRICKYDMESDHCDDIYGALILGKAKCDGIAKAYKFLLEEAGMECLILSGRESKEDVGHAWNVVRVGDRYYDVDITNDCGSRYNFNIYPEYNINKNILRNLYPVDSFLTENFDVPGVNNMDSSYYAKKGRFVYAGTDPMSALDNGFSLMAKDGKTHFSVQFENNLDYKDCIAHLEETIQSLGEKYDFYGSWQVGTMDDFKIITLMISGK